MESFKNKKEIINILKNDGVGVMPTDTIYGLVGSAFSKKAVDKIYKIKGRNDKKPFIVLISSISDLKKFKIKHTNKLQFIGMFNKFWPGKVSVILDCDSSKFKYLHRGIKSIAFRFPKNKKLIEILKKTGPLIAPSANPQGLKPAENIVQAKKYFGDNVDFYLSGGVLKGKPSTLIKIDKDSQIKILRGILKTNGK